MKRILLMAGPADSAGDPGESKPQIDLAAENKALKAQLAQAQGNLKAVGKNEGLIRKKMAVGLTREQAEASVRNQEAFDAKKKQDAKA